MRRRQAFNPLAYRCRCVAYFIITPEPPMGDTTPTRAHVERVDAQRIMCEEMLANAKHVLDHLRRELWDYNLRDSATMLVEEALATLGRVQVCPLAGRQPEGQPEGLLFRIVSVAPEIQTPAERVRFGTGRRMEVVMRFTNGHERPATDAERQAFGVAVASEVSR